MTTQSVAGDLQTAAAAASPTDPLSALMVRYQGGDSAAFLEIFQQLERPLRGYLVSMTRDLDRAEDLVQETLLQLHRSRHTYRPPKPVLPWAFGISRYVFLMDRRAAGRRQQVFDDGCAALPELPVPPRSLGFADRDALRAALGRLPEDQREVLLLHHVWGFSFAEIAGILGIRAGAAKVRSHRGIQRLRKLMGEASS